MTQYRPKVYTASNLKHQILWLKLRADPDWDFMEFTASWIDSSAVIQENQGEAQSFEVLQEAWITNAADIRNSDFLLLYGGGENLRGALVEAGIAIGLRIPVIAVAVDGSWTHYPSVASVLTLKEARTHLYKFTTMAPPTRKGRS